MNKSFSMYSALVLLFVSLTAFTNDGCGRETVDSKTAEKQEKMLAEASAQVGMPAIVNFQELKNFKRILELRDQEKLVCYAYLFSEQTGKLIFIGKCMGFGLPAATQFSNPMVARYGTNGNFTIPQADPNGLFMPASAEGTWVMLLDEKGIPHPVYIEPRVIVSPFPLAGGLQ